MTNAVLEPIHSASLPRSNISATVQPTTRRRLAWSSLSRMGGGAILLACLMIPDGVLHAKFFKLNMVLDNIHQRYFGPVSD